MATRFQVGPSRKAFSGTGSHTMVSLANGHGTKYYSGPGHNMGTKSNSTNAHSYLIAKSNSRKSNRKDSMGIAAMGGGALVAGFGGYKAYQHRDDIKKGAQKVIGSFHSSRQAHGNID